MQQEWRALRRLFFLVTLVLAVLAAGFSYWQWGPVAAVYSLSAALLLLSGFWVTEMLIGIFTGVKQATFSAKVLLFVAKLGWWGALFYASSRVTPDARYPIGLGFGAFLLGLLLAALFRSGWPKISDSPGV